MRGELGSSLDQLRFLDSFGCCGGPSLSDVSEIVKKRRHIPQETYRFTFRNSAQMLNIITDWSENSALSDANFRRTLSRYVFRHSLGPGALSMMRAMGVIPSGRGGDRVVVSKRGFGIRFACGRNCPSAEQLGKSLAIANIAENISYSNTFEQ